MRRSWRIRCNAMVTVVAVALGSASWTGPAASATVATPASPSFPGGALRSFPTPKLLRVAPIDADARPDLVVTSDQAGARSVAVLRGTPSGLGTPTTTPISGQAQDLETGDVDGDGTTDVVVALGAGGSQVLLGDGTGSFAASTVSVATTEVAVGRFVGDADADLVVASGSTITFLEGAGSSTFPTTGTTITTPSAVQDLLVADIDGDGDDDLVTATAPASGIPGRASIHRSTGPGTFAAPTDLAVGASATAVQLADLDGDGLDDLVITTTDAQGTIRWARATGGGAFAAAAAISLDTRTIALAVGDLDGDDDADLAAVDDDDALVVRLGVGDGTFGPSSSHASTQSPSAVALIDADGDGDLDPVAAVAASGQKPGGLVQLTNPGTGTFDAPTSLPSSSQHPDGAIATADLDGDGTLDAVHTRVLCCSGIGLQTVTFRISYGDDRGQLSTVQEVGSILPTTGVAVAPVDAGTTPDLVTASAGHVWVFPNLGGRTFGEAIKTPVSTLDGTDLAIADLDGDDEVDVVLLSRTQDQVKVLLGVGDGTFGSPTAYEVGDGPIAMDLADVDGDDALDLAVAGNGTTPSLAILRGAGDGSFDAAEAVVLPGSPTAIATAELDATPGAEVVVATGSAATSRIRTFTAASSAPTADEVITPAASPGSGSATVQWLAAGDLNGDGEPDLALDGERFLLGRGDGTLAADTQAGLAPEVPTKPTIVDVDGDGAADLLGVRFDRLVTRYGGTGAVVPPPYAPFSSWGALVDRQHRDLLGRAPTSAERSADVAALGAGSLTPGGLIARLRSSTDHVGNVDPIVRLYRAYFLRNPDPGGLDYWVNRRRAGATLSSASTSFARSSEFQRRYGALTDRQFVDLVYANVLGRPGDAGGVSYWTRRLEQKKASRGQVMLNFSESNEYRTKQTSEVHAAVLLTWMLRQRPPATTFDQIVAALDAGSTVASAGELVLDLPAYASRVAGL